MTRNANQKPKRASTSRCVLLGVVFALFVARDAPAHELLVARRAAETALGSRSRDTRLASWATALRPIEVTAANTGARDRIRLYDSAGDIDETARAAFERVAAQTHEPHRLATRVEQLLFKAAYHFGGAALLVVSAWRDHAGRHTAGEAVDFKLRGVAPAEIAAYLRRLAKVGVGIYTHPGTQFVHLDVRDPSYFWVDGSAPGRKGAERHIPDGGAARRDAAYAPEMDLPTEH